MNADQVFVILSKQIKDLSAGTPSAKINLTSNIAVGAIDPNSKVNHTSAQLWEWALVKKMALRVSLTSSLDITKVYEIGTTQSTNLTIGVNKVAVGGSDIVSGTYSSTPNDPTFVEKPLTSLTTYSDTVSTSFDNSMTYTVSALDKNGLTGKATINFKFAYPMYISLIDLADISTLTEPIIKASGNKIIAQKTNQNFTLNSGGVYKYPLFCYPASYGSLTSIMDIANGFDLIGNYTKGSINMTCADGTTQPYTYYVANIYNDFINFKIQFNF